MRKISFKTALLAAEEVEAAVVGDRNYNKRVSLSSNDRQKNAL